MNLYSAARTGEYEALGNPQWATHVVAHSFGFREGPDGMRLPGPINEQLGQHLGALGVTHLPWAVQEEIYAAVPWDIRNARRVAGVPTDIIRQVDMPTGVYLSSAIVWDKAKQQAESLDVNPWRPLVIAQAHHVGRVAAQGRFYGAQPIVPPGLAKDFDPQSAQQWTTSSTRWYRRERLALTKFKLDRTIK